MTLKAELRVRLEATQTGESDFGSVSFTPLMQLAQALADGTGANQADVLWMDERPVADGANDDLDLSGALTDVFGNSVNMAEVVAIFIINAPRSGSANTTDLTVGGATNAFEGFLGGTSPTIGPIKPGGFLAIGAGDAAGIGAVTGGSEDELRIANSAGAAATYQVAIIGRSA
ncbi:hypothetical protein PVW46_24670 [Mameliella sp. AT18]|uniref:hypothetical protein n=1 Tax=Mameliella sp. AT18 TaxID=3028385 RepID=UPI00237B41C6|nr:hypothetical protein [Mameliella sp. AT18]MDD9733107.1 hypothetical protein [Mameliella sp. AT18]